jgi:hypothetical protein
MNPIEPDTKDWTWVLDERCGECGFAAADVAATEVAGRVRATVPVYREALGASDAAVRPQPTTWSPLEYACHVRDVHRLYTFRLGLMLEHDDPEFPNWDQDETAVAERYGEQDPAVVADQLAEAAEAMAQAYESVSGAQWQRTGRRSDGKDFTVDTFSRYFLHDIEHHVCDITGRPAGSWL